MLIAVICNMADVNLIYFNLSNKLENPEIYIYIYIYIHTYISGFSNLLDKLKYIKFTSAMLH